MAGMKGVDCACGFTFRTPHGDNDVVAVVQDHVKRIHPTDFPKGVSRAEALGMAKTF